MGYTSKPVAYVAWIILQILHHINTAVENGRHRNPDPGVPQVSVLLAGTELRFVKLALHNLQKFTANALLTCNHD